MALVLIEGFDHFNTTTLATLKGWTFTNPLVSGTRQWTGAFTTGRVDGQAFTVTMPTALVCTVQMSKTLPAPLTTIVLGFAFRTTLLPAAGSAGRLYAAWTAAAAQVLDVRILDTGALYINGITSPVNKVFANTWHYCEVKAVIAGASGSVQARIDGIEVIPTTTVNLGSTGVQTAGIYSESNNGWITGSATVLDFDDFYVMDSSGAVNTSFAGDVHVSTLYPSADGANTGLTPDTGTPHYSRVNEHPPDGDTSYVGSATVGTKDTYICTDVPSVAGPVTGIQTNLWARKDDAGTRQIAPVVRLAGTDQVGSSLTLATTYVDLTEIYDVEPGSGTGWTITDVNAAEFGVEVVT
jgi:hypothetical protein